MQNIALIIPTVYWCGSLKLWAHLALEEKYWKYLINGIVNSPTPPTGTHPTPTTERIHTPSPPSPPRPSQFPLTLPPPRQRKIFSPIPSPREAPIPPRAQKPRYDTDGVGKTRRDLLGILLLTGTPTEIEIKTQFIILVRI